MALNTRKPTGLVAYPLILVEGAEKVGKSYAAFSLSASERVGRTFVFDWSEGTGDEYASLGPYELIEHDGTFTGFIDQLAEAMAVEMADGKPNVIVIDSGTVLWEGLKNWASARARNSQSNRRLLAKDPDAEINVSSTYWNDANDRWGRMVHMFGRWPGIGVVICRGKEVAKMGRDGNPVAGQTEYRIEAQKAFGYSATAHVRIEAPKHARLMDVRSLTVEVPAAGIPLPADAPLEHLVFGIIGAGSGFQTSTAIDPQFGRMAADAKAQLVDVFTRADYTRDDAVSAASAVWAAGPCPDAAKDDEVSDQAWADLVAAATAAIDAEEPGAES